MPKNNKKSTLKKIIIGLGLAVLIAGSYLFLYPITGSFSKGDYLYIHTGADYEQVKKSLLEGGFINHIKTFDWVAKQAHYPNQIHPGKYAIKKGMSVFSIVRMLRSGRQEPVKLVINKLRTVHDFVQLVGMKTEADTNTLKKMLRDNNFLAQYGLDSNTALCAIFPDTYEMNWNTTPEKIFEKIQKAESKFWTSDRKQKASNQKLSPVQVTILASIVEEETNQKAEKPMVAAVYLNRFHTGMKLQADPTAKFAYGDFTLKRITEKQTSLASPYNTYYVTGLPIGPICTPSPSSIDGVLNATNKEVLFFCAKEDGSGFHRFSKTYGEHLNNANKYHEALNQRGIH